MIARGLFARDGLITWRCKTGNSRRSFKLCGRADKFDQILMDTDRLNLDGYEFFLSSRRI